jgi:DNA-binding response OmpR family regulator
MAAICRPDHAMTSVVSRIPAAPERRRKVLVVEDDPHIAHVIGINLRDQHYDVAVAASGPDALAHVESHDVELVVLDVMLPGLDGFAVCEQIRRRSDYIPVLMLTARTTELDRILGLELGADDYLAKPFGVRELIARVKALFRRADALTSATARAAPALVTTRSFVIDVALHTVLLTGRPVELTGKEFDLLLEFARNPGRPYTRSELLDLVCGYGHQMYGHTVNSHINRLRAKIETDAARP